MTGSSPDAGRPKRPPPTIELTAAEVTERPAAAEPAVPETASESIDTAPSDMPPSEPAAEAAVGKAGARLACASPVLVPAAVGAVAGALVARNCMVRPERHCIERQGRCRCADLSHCADRSAPGRLRRIRGLATRIDTLEKSIAGLRGDLAAAKTQSIVSSPITSTKSAPRTATGVVGSRADQ